MIDVISLFSGCGGLDLGLEKKRTFLIAANDFDPDAIATLKKNKRFFHGSKNILEGDVKDFDIKSFLKFRNKKNPLIIIGGPPCQPFSKNGYWITNKKRLKELDPRNHISYFLKVVKETNADGFLLENVESILHPSNKHVADKIMELSNRELGFNMKLIKANACEFGVPQKRKRVFFLGTKGNFTGEILKTHAPDGKKDLFSNLPEFVSAGEAIGEFDENKYFEETEICNGTFAEELKLIPPGENYLFLTKKKGCADPKFEYGTRFWQFLLKLDPKKPSWTIAAQPGPWTGPFHWTNRRLRVPEIAALQTFPESYKFVGSRRSIQRQIGNAVPPKLAKAMTGYLLDSLE